MKSVILGLVMVASFPAFGSEKLKDVVVRDGIKQINGEFIVEGKNFDHAFTSLDNPAIRIGVIGQSMLILSEGNSANVLCASLDATKAIATDVSPAGVSDMSAMGYSTQQVAVLSLENGQVVAKLQPAKADDLVLTLLECADHALNTVD